MTPTNKLRFVQRKVIAPEFGPPDFEKTIRVLQQWWRPANPKVDIGEWRDVPLEVET